MEPDETSRLWTDWPADYRGPMDLNLTARAASLSTCVCLVLAAPTSALAQEEEPSPEYVVDFAEEDPEAAERGWEWTLSMTGNLSLSDNRSVVDQTDGTTITFGYKLDSAFDYRRGSHELRSTFSWAEGLTKTPNVDGVIKARDELAKEAVYLYHLVEIFGPFARVYLSAPTFRGADVRPELTTYVITGADGTQDTVLQQRLALTDPLRPLTLKQSVGVFLQPLDEEEVSLEHRLGLGARETLADDQLAITDDEATPDVVEVTELESVYQLGVELVTTLWGKLYEERLAYKLAGEIMIPFASNNDDDRSALELTNIEGLAELKVRLAEVASLDYQLKIKREPQLLDEVQIQNNLLLSLGVEILERSANRQAVIDANEAEGEE
jgi:hypothetical protein